MRMIPGRSFWGPCHRLILHFPFNNGTFVVGYSHRPVAFLHGLGPCLQQHAAREAVDDDYLGEVGRRPSEKILRLAEEMTALSVLELSDVADLLKRKLRINDSMMPLMVRGMPMAGAGGADIQVDDKEKKAEKTHFDVRLDKYDAAVKIKIIKEVRVFTSLGLKEAKELVEKIPAILKKGVSKEEATQIVEKLNALGATVVME